MTFGFATLSFFGAFGFKLLVFFGALESVLLACLATLGFVLLWFFATLGFGFGLLAFVAAFGFGFDLLALAFFATFGPLEAVLMNVGLDWLGNATKSTQCDLEKTFQIWHCRLFQEGRIMATSGSNPVVQRRRSSLPNVKLLPLTMAERRALVFCL